MYSKYSYSKKVLMLFIAFVLFLFFAYHFSISKTITIINDINLKQEKLVWLKSKEKEIPFLQSQIAILDKVYTYKDSSSIRDQLTQFISDNSEKLNCIVTEIPETSFYNSPVMNIQTNKFVIKGDYISLLKLMLKVETKYNYTAKLVSAKFYSMKNNLEKNPNLYLILITQSFKQYEKN